MRFENAFNYRTLYYELTMPRETWHFPDFTSSYWADCSAEDVVPVFITTDNFP